MSSSIVSPSFNWILVRLLRGLTSPCREPFICASSTGCSAINCVAVFSKHSYVELCLPTMRSRSRDWYTARSKTVAESLVHCNVGCRTVSFSLPPLRLTDKILFLLSVMSVILQDLELSPSPNLKCKATKVLCILQRSIANGVMSPL